MADFTHYDRLSALDDSFLELEDGSAHMHIGAVAIFERDPLADANGHLDLDRIQQLMGTGLYRLPRYRQRLAYVPVFRHPVWVDDPHFNLAYHVRHTALPPPGDERQLKRLAARIMSQQLDRGKPLWELWVIEGLADRRLALLTKVHHCMVDGVGSVELTAAIMRPTPEPDPRLSEPAPHWLPRPVPSAAALFLDELRRRATAPLAAARGLARLAATPRDAVAAIRDVTAAMGDVLSHALRPASPTPFNGPIGPHRRFDWTATPLAGVKAIGAAVGGTVNDVVLGVLTGALRRFLYRRGIDPAPLDFRVMMPVNVRPAAEQGQLGNRVSMMVARLPLDERGTHRRVERLIEETRRAKQSHQALGMELIEELSDHTFTALFTEFARLTAAARPFNIVVTNVPGPPFPVYVLGAKMTACHPLVPLYANQGLGIALFSYDGTVHWGFNADWGMVPDLHDLVIAVDREFATMLEELVPAAAVAHAG